MSLAIRESKTATGKAKLIIGRECAWDDFPAGAQQIVNEFHMVVREKIDGLDERMWITAIGEATFCISWDTWFPEVSVMAWESTPDTAVRELTTGT